MNEYTRNNPDSAVELITPAMYKLVNRIRHIFDKVTKLFEKVFCKLQVDAERGQVSVGAEASAQASGSQSTAVRYPRRKRSKPNYYGRGP